MTASDTPDVRENQTEEAKGQARSEARGNEATGANDGLRGDVLDFCREASQRLEAAKRAFAAVAEAVRRAADSLADSGVPPDYHVLNEIGTCHREFLRLKNDLIRGATELGLAVPEAGTLDGLGDLARMIHELSPDAPVGTEPDSPVPPGQSATEARAATIVPPSSPPSSGLPEPTTLDPVPPYSSVLPEETGARPSGLDASQRFLLDGVTARTTPRVVEDSLNVPGEGPTGVGSVTRPPVVVDHESHEAVRRAALEVLDTALATTVRSGGTFPALSDCLAGVGRLRDFIVAAPPGEVPGDLERLAAGEHPVQSLLALIRGSEGLDDLQRSALHREVSEAFGAELAALAICGRLTTDR